MNGLTRQFTIPLVGVLIFIFISLFYIQTPHFQYHLNFIQNTSFKLLNITKQQYDEVYDKYSDKTSKPGLLQFKSDCSCRKETVSISSVDNDTFEINVTKRPSYRVTKAEMKSIKCDLYNVLRRGFGQKVIGYSLFGTDNRYYKVINNIIKSASVHYPGWIIRIYYDDSINPEAICKFECNKTNNVDFCNIQHIPHHNSTLPAELDVTHFNADYMHKMMWRWFPIADPFVDQFMSRDIDSVIIPREVASVMVWLNSNTLFHIMRDHPQHSIEMLGGMWGFKPIMNRDLSQNIFKLLIDKNTAEFYRSGKNHYAGGDQAFLTSNVWPHAKANSTIHDSYHCKTYGGVGFPTQRTQPNCFIACIGICCDKEIDTKENYTPCPVECRPDGHKDWKYC